MKEKKIFALSAIFAICFAMTGCGNANQSTEDETDEIVLNVYNCADYISETDGENIGVLEQFEEYCLNVLGKKVSVTYSTYETNEDMFNQLKAGGVQYDLVCPSEYMIEKMIKEGMVEKLTAPISNYEQYGSPYIKDTFNGLTTEKGESFAEYAVPYMWGTMGFMYDPSKVTLDAVSSWDIIWDEKYKNQSSLKDSIRDTYVSATLHIYKEELLLLKDLYSRNLITASEYTDKVSNIMNRCDDSTINLVGAALKSAKENIYEFEVDTGKENIIKGKYYVNLCWSGDAVYSLDLAEEEGVILNYKIPEEGSNIWFDGWVMPKGANVELAQELMNFLCDPSIASQNMGYVGYTSGVAGQEIWELVKEWYDSDEEGTVEYDLTYFFKDTGIVDENGNLMDKFIIHTKDVNRQLFAQYPDYETIIRCGTMKDFGTQNDKVTEMWISVKGNEASWVIFVFLGVVIGLVVLFEVKNAHARRARKSRNRSR